METLSYYTNTVEQPAQSRPRWGYVIAGVAVGLCHFVGSMVFLVCCYRMCLEGYTGRFEFNPVLYSMLNYYESPRELVERLNGLTMLGGKDAFIVLALEIAIIWGVAAALTWRVTSATIRLTSRWRLT
jgi:hypothetical protein